MYVTTNFEFNASETLKITTNIAFNQSDIRGDFDDSYGNPTTGSFNSWFSRGIDIGKLKELQNLVTANGYSASWNWWGPEYYAYYGSSRNSAFQKAAFWFNPYKHLDQI